MTFQTFQSFMTFQPTGISTRSSTFQYNPVPSSAIQYTSVSRDSTRSSISSIRMQILHTDWFPPETPLSTNQRQYITTNCCIIGSTNPCRITCKEFLMKQTKMYVCTLEEFILVDIWIHCCASWN